MNESNSMIITVATDWHFDVTPCIFNRTFNYHRAINVNSESNGGQPRTSKKANDCPLSMWIRMTLLMIDVIYGSQYEVRFVGGVGFGFRPGFNASASSAFQPNGTYSVLEMIYFGQADLSPPYMSLTYERARLLNRHLGPILRENVIFVYQKLSDRRLLNIFEICSIELQCFFYALLAIHLVARLTLWAAKKFLKPPLSVENRSRAERCVNHLDLCLLIVLTVLFGILSSEVVVAFSRPLEDVKPFSDVDSLAEALASSRYRPVTSGFYYNAMFGPGAPIGTPNYQLREAVRSGSGFGVKKLKSTEVAQEYFEKLDPQSERANSVLITGSIDGMRLMKKHCDFRYFKDPSAFPWPSFTSYRSEAFYRRLTPKLNYRRTEILSVGCAFWLLGILLLVSVTFLIFGEIIWVRVYRVYRETLLSSQRDEVREIKIHSQRSESIQK